MRRKKQPKQADQVPAAPMEVSEEEFNRVRAMAMIDEVNTMYLELVRTNRCPACEQIVTWETVEKHPHHEKLNALSGQEASEYLQWTSTHLKDCTFVPGYQALSSLAARFHIVVALKQVDIGSRPDGKVTRDLFPVRVPAPGDPPVPD